MSAKISILDELASILSKKEKTDEGILVFSKQFKIGRLLQPFASIKKQGFSLRSILVALILSRLGGLSISAMQQTGNLKMDDNTIYRLMNNQLINWRSIIHAFAKQFLRCVAQKGEIDSSSVKCFVLDDTDIVKTGKTFEGISKIFSHVSHRFEFGYKMLTLAFWDGKSLIPCGFSLHRENKKNGYGLNKKQEKRQFGKTRQASGYFQERYRELDEEKCTVAVKCSNVW